MGTLIYKSYNYKESDIVAKYIDARIDGTIVIHEVNADCYTIKTSHLDADDGVSDELIQKAVDQKCQCFNQVLVWGECPIIKKLKEKK